MRYVSSLLEAMITLVFVFGLLGSLLTGSRTTSRPLARPSSGLKSHAWVSGFGGTMGWDGSNPLHPSAAPSDSRRQET